MTSYPSRRSPRLLDYDYASAGAYFVTLCVQNELSLLGHIDDDIMHLSPAGTMVASVWGNLETYYGVGVDTYMVR